MTSVDATLLATTSPSRAIPQTSECATNSCDDNDYSGRDLTKEFYTKGSMKRANFSNSNLSGVTLFGGDLSYANFTGADLSNANIGQVRGRARDVVSRLRARALPPRLVWFRIDRRVPLPPSLSLQCNLTGTIFTNANLSGAIVSGANMYELGDITGSDWTDVIVRKDVNDKICAKGVSGENPVTGNPTAMTLFCD